MLVTASAIEKPVFMVRWRTYYRPVCAPGCLFHTTKLTKAATAAAQLWVDNELAKKNQQKGVVLRQRRRGRCSFSGETVPTSQIIEPAGGQTFIAISPRQEAEPIIKTIRANVASLITRVTQPINVEKTMVSEATSLMPSRQFNFPSVNVQRQQAIN
ncbi:MAG: hypothetical protein Q9194_004887 [Teloschistes cf. exilis]